MAGWGGQRQAEAEGEAHYILQTGKAEAEKVRLMGEAQGVAYHEQVNALGAQGVALVETLKVIGAQGVRITSDILAAGGAGDGSGGIGTLLLLNLFRTRLNLPAANGGKFEPRRAGDANRECARPTNLACSVNIARERRCVCSPLRLSDWFGMTLSTRLNLEGAMELQTLPWELPTSWPSAAAQHVSWDGQVYRRCAQCGTEVRELQELVGETFAAALCANCRAEDLVFVRHLVQAEYQCNRCSTKFEIESAEFDRPRCPQCQAADLRSNKSDIVPPFPREFDQALVNHRWGVSGNEDARLIMSALQAVSFSGEVDRQFLLLTRFCRRLRLYGGYSNAHDREIIRNIEGNIFRDYFRMTSELPAGVEALKLFEEGKRAASDPRERALDEHNVAMAVYSMLARYSEREVILHTGRPDVRTAAISAAERALTVFADQPDAASRTQAAKIHHIMGDLLRAGDSTEAELQLSLEHFEAALRLPGIPAALRANIKESRTATLAALPPAARPAKTGVLRRLANLLKPSAERSTEPAPLPVTAAKPQPATPEDQFRNPNDLQISVVHLDGDAEQIAENLIRDALPKTFLDAIDISDDAGKARLIACLMLRQRQASLEKDEILRFVERNRRALEAGGFELLRLMTEAGKHTEGGADMVKFFQYFTEQVEAALAGRPQDIDVKSDRLLWLLYALAQKLSTGSLVYDDALTVLSKPEHRDRISPLTLRFLLHDYAESIGQTSEVPTEYVMLIDECALMIDDVPAAAAATGLLAKISPPREIKPLIDLLQRARTLLAANGRSVEDADEALARLRSRYEEAVADDDL